MDYLYFVAMLVGVAWLAVWSILPKPYSDEGWWPFDMVEDGASQGAAGTARAEGRRLGARGGRGAPPSWRDRAPQPAAPELQQHVPPHRRRTAQAGGTRREPPAPPFRRPR